MQTSIEIITPEVACRYLNLNISTNRKLKYSNIKFLVDELKGGRWRLTHQGIAFNKDGFLIDGQNRLSAIVDSGISAQMMVSRGVENEAFKVMDNGVKRSFAESTGIQKNVVEIIPKIINLMDGASTTKRAHRISSIEISEFYEKNKIIEDILLSLTSSSRKYFSSSPIRLAALAQILRGNECVRKNYSDLVNLNLNDSSQIVKAFIKLRINLNLKTSDYNLAFCYSMIVFDDNKQSNTRIKMNEEIINNNILIAKNIFNSKLLR